MERDSCKWFRQLVLALRIDTFEFGQMKNIVRSAGGVAYMGPGEDFGSIFSFKLRGFFN